MKSDEASPLDRSGDHSAPPAGPTGRLSAPHNGASSSVDDEPAPDARDRFFNPFRNARSKEARGLIDEVRREVESRELRLKLRQRRRSARDKANHAKAVAAVIADTLHHHWAYPGDWLAVRQVLLRLIDHEVVALPINDCVIVPEKHLNITTETMEEVFKDYLGVSAVVSVGR